MSGPDIQRATHLSINDVACLHQAMAKSISTLPPVTGWQMLQANCPPELQTQWLTMGCPVLDKFLRGGIPSNGVTEIAGVSASGKTQLCLQLCLMAQFQPKHGGMGKGALYICTEDVFPNKRLVQLANNHVSLHNDKLLYPKPTDHVYIEHASEVDDLCVCLKRKAPLLLSQGRVGLIVLDSIAAVFRSEFGLKNLKERAKHLSSIGAQLHDISNKYNIPVICVNQVSDVMGVRSGPSTRSVLPALGIAWANLVTTRLLLIRTQRTVVYSTGDGQTLDANVRSMEVLFAPHLPQTICYFVVTDQGVSGLSADYQGKFG